MYLSIYLSIVLHVSGGHSDILHSYYYVNRSKIDFDTILGLGMGLGG